ncbi:MAG: DUF3786 domain-containing protein [Lachnospiraceae bacterium]|nr:DUF3786 domain-containing protein [Lachnospiraceae bacterium]
MRTSFIREDGSNAADHYVMVCENWRETFRNMDHTELITRFGLDSDAEALYITYYNERYRLDRASGMIVLAADPERELGFNTVMSVYNLFYYSKPGAKVCGEFVPFRLVKRASPFDAAFRRTVIRPLARRFNGHADLLKKACEALNGEPIRQGDVGYVIHAFDCIPVTMVFWDGDDEFEAQANLLFDADITDFLHEETVCCIGADLVRRLAEEAGLEEAEQLLGPR